MRKQNGNFNKKIVLIEPRSPGEHIFSLILLPRVGIVLLAAILKKQGYDVTVMIENFNPIDWNIIKEADLVGISIITCTAPRGYEIAQKCRDLGKITVMGGSHATFLYEEAIKHVDYVCLFESENSFPDLVRTLFYDKNIKKVKGIVYRDSNEQLIKTEPAEIIQNFDSFPFPDYSLIHGHPKMSITPIITSRGCPFDCDFCSVIKMFGQKMRYRSVENVIEEIKYQKPSHIFFYDDNFIVNKSRAKEILKEMLKFSGQITWSAQVRATVAKDKELMDLIKKSGCEYLYIGFESINPETLRSYNKKLDVEEIKECMAIFRKNRINVHGMFVLGSEYDTKETVRRTYEFAQKSGIASVQFLNLTPLPGTDLWNRKQNDFLTRDWSLFDAHHVVLRSASIAPYQLQKETIKIMKKFYSLRHIISGIFSHGFFVAKLRYFGRLTLRKWIKNNLYYFRFLKSLK